MNPTFATARAVAWMLLVACACDDGEDRSNCTTGTWHATLTRPGEHVVPCGSDGQITEDLTLTVVEIEAGGTLCSLETAPNDPPPGEACRGYVQRWNGDPFQEGTFTYVLPAQEWVDCNATRTSVTVNFGIDATVSADCSKIVGTAWQEPADRCDAGSGRWQAPITFEKVSE